MEKNVLLACESPWAGSPKVIAKYLIWEGWSSYIIIHYVSRVCYPCHTYDIGPKAHKLHESVHANAQLMDVILI